MNRLNNLQLKIFQRRRIIRRGDDSDLVRPISSTGMVTRGQTMGNLKVPMGRHENFAYQAAKLWNASPAELRTCVGKNSAKKIICTFVQSLHSKYDVRVYPFKFPAKRSDQNKPDVAALVCIYVFKMSMCKTRN